MNKLVNIAAPLIFATGFILGNPNVNASPDKEDSGMIESVPASRISDSSYVINANNWMNSAPLQFAYNDITKDLDLRGLEAKAILLNFWGAWCSYCRADAPNLEKMWKQYEDSGLVVVSLHNYEDSFQGAYDFATKNNLTYPIGMEDRGDLTSKRYGVRSVPYQVLINHNGNVIARGHPHEIKSIVDSVMVSD